jgi:hypothetical protein
MRHKLLANAKKVLHEDIHSIYREDNILELATEKDGRPFAYLIVEEAYPDTVIISFAADFYNVQLAARVSLDLHRIAKVELGEEFFISISNQKLYWGDEAVEMAVLEGGNVNENLQILLDSTPINGLKC